MRWQSRMHCIAVSNAAILDHQDDDADLLHHCIVSVSLLTVPGLPSFKEYIFQRTHFSGWFQISHIRYGKHSTGI